MRIFYDCEFIEDGHTIDLISIGMVAEDGRELYAVNRHAPWRRIKKHDWLMANVVPHLPQPHGDWIRQMPKSWPVDFHNPAVKAREAIRDDVRAFVEATPDAELWAWYGAYDHVCYAQLFGKMIDLPKGFPMWTNDLKQEVERLGSPSLPKQEGAEHNALADARWVKQAYESLADRHE